MRPGAGREDAHDLLTLLVESRDPDSGRGLCEREIKANIFTFIAAGHETTANAITWALYLLTLSPEWLSLLATEAEREWQGPPAGLTERLVKTRAVIEEALRLYPPLAAISRVAIGPDRLAETPIAAGTMIIIAPYVVHRHRLLWDDPEVFDPSRFLPGARGPLDRYAPAVRHRPEGLYRRRFRSPGGGSRPQRDRAEFQFRCRPRPRRLAAAARDCGRAADCPCASNATTATNARYSYVAFSYRLRARRYSCHDEAPQGRRG